MRSIPLVSLVLSFACGAGREVATDSDPVTGYVDTYDHYECGCYPGERRSCEADGFPYGYETGVPGYYECQGGVWADACYTDWSSECIAYPPEDPCDWDDPCEDGESCLESGWCAPIEPIPTCERSPLTPSEIPLQGVPSALALSDLDGDEALDLIAVLPAEGLVEVRFGDGWGGFFTGATFPTGLTPAEQRLAFADFDGNGWSDLAVTAAVTPGELSLLFGQAGMFDAPVLSTIGSSPTGVWAGDFDGDGVTDLLAHNASPELSLRTGDGMGGFADEFVHDEPGDAPFPVAVAPLKSSGRYHVVTTAVDPPGAKVLEYQPGVGFVTVQTLAGGGQTRYGAVALGDVDGDGWPDAVAVRAAGGGGHIHTWPGSADAPDMVVGELGELGPIADVDGDSRGDLVTAWSGVRVIYLDVPCVESYELPTATTLMAAGDVDSDGNADVVTASAGVPAVSLLQSGP